jgi:hypothetical protein
MNSISYVLCANFDFYLIIAIKNNNQRKICISLDAQVIFAKIFVYSHCDLYTHAYS